MVYSKYVRIYDADQFTRDFCASNGIILGPKQEVPEDPFIKRMTTKPKIVKDNIMKEYLEYSMGGGKVKNAKQFLENDRKVLRYYAKFEGLKYISTTIYQMILLKLEKSNTIIVVDILSLYY